MLHKEIPFLRIIIPLCIGIISALYTEPGPIFLLTATILIAVAFILTLLFNKRQTNTLYGLILTSALVLGGHLLYSAEKSRLTILDPKMSEIICTIADFPDERENTYRVRVRLNGFNKNDSIKTAGGSMLIYIRKDSSVASLLPGDILKIRCTPEEITNRGNPSEFDYRFYMENHGIRYLAFISKYDITCHLVPEKRKIAHKALIIRENIIDMYRNRGITGRRLALVAAITVGEKTLLEPEQKEIFIRAGVMHIMAVSGLHAMVLSMFVFNILFFLKRRFNVVRILSALIILWAFAFVTGLTPSVMRATLMFSFIQAGKLMQRPVNSLNSVLVSAFVLILIRPSAIFDAGFLLSYSAVMYIIAFYKSLYTKLLIKNLLADKIWQSAVVTLVAQAGTLPLTIMLFNRFPAYFLITNIIIVPLATLLIITGAMIPLFYPLAFLSGLLGKILNNITGLTEYLTFIAASLPGSSVGNIGMTVPECILLTCIITTLCYVLIFRKFRLVNYLLGLILIASVVVTVKEISVRRSNELIVYNVQGRSVVGIRTGRILNLYSKGENIAAEVLRHSSTLGLRIKEIIAIEKTACIKTGGRIILISEYIDSEILTEASPDIVILTGMKPRIGEFTGLKSYPDMVIITSEATAGIRLSDDLASHLNSPVHNTKKSGAFIMSL